MLLGLADLHERSGDWEAAIQVSRKVLGADPHREEAHVSLMRLNALSGRSAEALRQYGALEETLRLVGAEPSASSRALGRDCVGNLRGGACRIDEGIRSKRRRTPPAITTPRPGTASWGEREIVEVKGRSL